MTVTAASPGVLLVLTRFDLLYTLSPTARLFLYERLSRGRAWRAEEIHLGRLFLASSVGRAWSSAGTSGL